MLFEDYATTSRRDRYNITCSIGDNKIEHTFINDEASSNGGIPMPYNSTKYYLISFVITLNFVESLLKSFKTNYERQKINVL